jgi:hypothetical protein
VARPLKQEKNPTQAITLQTSVPEAIGLKLEWDTGYLD